jgi:hypothetical protein
MAKGGGEEVKGREEGEEEGGRVPKKGRTIVSSKSEPTDFLEKLMAPITDCRRGRTKA